jgi:hypothetical protein
MDELTKLQEENTKFRKLLKTSVSYIETSADLIEDEIGVVDEEEENECAEARSFASEIREAIGLPPAPERPKPDEAEGSVG